jgi:hypothetical protein
LSQSAHVFLELRRVERPVRLEHEGLDRIVVMMVRMMMFMLVVMAAVFVVDVVVGVLIARMAVARA